MKDFKIWCNTEKEKNAVTGKMLSEKLTWEKRAKLIPSDNVGFIVYKGKISWTDHNLAFALNILPEITPEEYTKENEKEMKKSDLKTGYLVVTRDGHEYVVYLNVLTDYQHDKKPEDIIVCNQGDSRRWDGLDVYNEDLTYKGKENRNDIMEVYLLYHPFALQDMSYYKQMRKLLWKREETKELTIKQIEEILGYSIKIIKE